MWRAFNKSQTARLLDSLVAARSAMSGGAHPVAQGIAKTRSDGAGRWPEASTFSFPHPFRLQPLPRLEVGNLCPEGPSTGSALWAVKLSTGKFGALRRVELETDVNQWSSQDIDGGQPPNPKGRPHLCGRGELSTGEILFRGAVGNLCPEGPSTGSALWAVKLSTVGEQAKNY